MRMESGYAHGSDYTAIGCLVHTCAVGTYTESSRAVLNTIFLGFVFQCSNELESKIENQITIKQNNIQIVEYSGEAPESRPMF